MGNKVLLTFLMLHWNYTQLVDVSFKYYIIIILIVGEYTVFINLLVNLLVLFNSIICK